MTRTWRDEFEEDFDVPAEITGIEGVIDQSWHNDACPRFNFDVDGAGPSLYVDHPDPDQRENGPGMGRFLLVSYDENGDATDDDAIYEGNDLAHAVAAFINAVLAWRAERFT